jgi:hypothetical protein
VTSSSVTTRYIRCNVSTYGSLQFWILHNSLIKQNIVIVIPIISTMATPKPLRIGVFIPHNVQLLDLSPIDLFYMQSPEYLTACSLPPSIISLGTPCESTLTPSPCSLIPQPY